MTAHVTCVTHHACIYDSYVRKIFPRLLSSILTRVKLPTVPHDLCQQLVLCRIDRMAVLVLDLIVSSLLIVEYLSGRAGPEVHTWPNTLYLDLLSFLRNIFIAKQIYLLFLIEFYVNRLNNLMCHGLDTFFKSFKLQAWRKATTFSGYQQEVFLPSRWASCGDMRPFSRDVAGHVGFHGFQSFQNCHLPSRNTDMCCATYVRLHKCKDSSSFQAQAWYRNFPWKLNE